MVREVEARRHHADDGGRPVVDANRLSDDGWVAAVAALPQLVTQDGDWCGAGSLVGGDEIASEDRALAEHAERVGAQAGDVVAVRRADAIAKTIAEAAGADDGHVVEGRGAGAPVFEVRVRHHAAAGDVDDPVLGIDARKAPEERRVRDREHGDVDADADGERQHGNRGEARVAAELTQCAARIAEHLIERWPAPHLHVETIYRYVAAMSNDLTLRMTTCRRPAL